jgi:Carboxypeptidase regulatory-like domain
MSIGTRVFIKAVPVLVLLSSSLSAQTTFATITGTVTDPTGSVVSGVTVIATHVQSNIQTTVQANEAGVFTLAQLKEGEYSVRARARASRNSWRKTEYCRHAIIAGWIFGWRWAPWRPRWKSRLEPR